MELHTGNNRCTFLYPRRFDADISSSSLLLPGMDRSTRRVACYRGGHVSCQSLDLDAVRMVGNGEEKANQLTYRTFGWSWHPMDHLQLEYGRSLP